MQKKDTLTNNFISQEELVRAIKSNDQRVLKTIYQDNYYKTEKYIIENSGSRQEAKDIYQEAFITVWENVHNNKFIPQNETALNGYIYGVAKNKWLDYLKSSRFKKTRTIAINEYKLHDEIDFGIGNETQNEEEIIKKVMINFNQIAEGCKKILTVFYYENKSLREISKELNITEASARNKKYRCLEKLRANVLTSN